MNAGSNARPDTPDPLTRLFDTFVFAPIGFALEAPRLIPELVEKGRAKADEQVRLARTIGRFVVPIARRKGEAALRERFADLASQIENIRRNAGRSGPTEASSAVTTEPATETAATEGATTAPLNDTAPSTGSLAIEGYDALPASSIVGLLDGLSARDLRAIGAYERGHRGRRTILAKTDQLLTQELAQDSVQELAK